MDTPAGSSRRRVRTGLFEIDLSSGEVHKNGRKVPLQEQPFRVLAMLLERRGEIVSREELQARLWPADTYVGFDEGLNTAIRKLRVAFGDSADNPRFIETVPRRGYRVISPIKETVGVVVDTPPRAENAGTALSGAGAPRARGNGDGAEVHTDLERVMPDVDWQRFGGLVQPKTHQRGPNAQTRARRMRIASITAGSAGVLLAALFVFRWLSSPPPPRVLRITPLTHYGHVEAWGKISTDGARIVFLRKEADGSSLMQVPVSGGESQPFPSPFRSTRILDISPDRSEFLVEPFTTPGSDDMEFWMLPVVGGSPRRLSDLTGLDGAFFAGRTKDRLQQARWHLHLQPHWGRCPQDREPALCLQGIGLVSQWHGLALHLGRSKNLGGFTLGGLHRRK